MRTLSKLAVHSIPILLNSMKLIRCLPSFVSAIAVGLVLSAISVTPTLLAQEDTASLPHGTVASGDLPASRQQLVQVMVELKDAPASTIYATALKQAQANYDAQRSYALAHPTLRTSQAFLKQASTTTSIQISLTAANQVKTAVSKINQIQQNLVSSLTGANIGGKVMFRAQRAYNG